MRRNRKKRRDEGFTLLELSIVIVLLGIIFAATVPALIKSLDIGKQKAEANAIISMATTLISAGQTYVNDHGSCPTAWTDLVSSGYLTVQPYLDLNRDNANDVGAPGSGSYAWGDGATNDCAFTIRVGGPEACREIVAKMGYLVGAVVPSEGVKHGPDIPCDSVFASGGDMLFLIKPDTP